MMFTWISRFLDRLFAVIGALVFSQLPAYFQQYTQRLAGHLAEVTQHLTELSRLAQLSGKSLTEYIYKFSTSHDLDFSRQGALMQQLLDRQHQLSDAYLKLTQASPLTRPYVFLSHLDPSIAKGALNDFQPALALTPEGIVYAFVGIVIGYALYSFISTGLRHLVRPLFSSKKS